MNRRKGLRVLCLLMVCLMLGCAITAHAQTSGQEGRFVLVVESGGKTVIAPEYVYYTEGQTLGEALVNSGHTFTGIEQGQVTAIDGVTGNYTRSDQAGGYDLTVDASTVTHFRFSENVGGSQPNEGLQALMTAMADYLTKEADVQNAAKDAYQTALTAFVGCGSDNAKMLAMDLNDAVQTYEQIQSGTHWSINFTDGSKDYSVSNYPGVKITATNPYGKVWTDEGDGKLQLPVGVYSFCVEQSGLRVEGTIEVSEDSTVAVKLPDQLWLKMDSFRLSGSYGAETNEEHKFTDAEFEVGSWIERQITVPVMDLFSGAVYIYAEFDGNLLNKTPKLTAVYTMANSGEQMEKSLAFESLNSGAYEVLAKGAEGNTVIYRLTHESDDGYIYSQDYTVIFARVPTLSGITVVDQDGTDQAATHRFSGAEREYTYKVLDTTTAVTVTAKGMQEDYDIFVNGQPLGEGVTVSVIGVTDVEVTVCAGGFTNTYHLQIKPGEGKTLSFLSDKSITIEVVNSNGVVMPFTTHRETATQNRYKYTLVPGETYSYIATKDSYYHIADDFRLEEVANSTITVDFAHMDDWLKDLAFGRAKGSKQKGTIALNTEFDPAIHAYTVDFEDTEHLAYVWVGCEDENTSIQAIYTQVFSSELYHGKEFTLDLTSGLSTGEQLKRFLMDENPVENTVTIRLTKIENGVTYFQDYQFEFKRTLSMKEMSAKCDGITTILNQEDGTLGFKSDVKEYSVSVSMAAKQLELFLDAYQDNTCYGEEAVGYRILMDGVDVTAQGVGVIELDGTIQTQTVTITVENDKAPEGTGTYVVHIKKAPPVEVTFVTTPAEAQLSLYEVLSGERLWPGENGTFLLCEGYSYSYTLTEYGYVSRFGVLEVTHDETNTLVILDGDESYLVLEGGIGGMVDIVWTLDVAPVNPEINESLYSPWPNFRGNASNNAISTDRIPTAAEEGTLYWANQIGSGIDADAVGSPILVGDDIITYASDKLYRVNTVTGEIIAIGKMDHKSSFSITPPTYAEGMVFVALSNGCVQAFNAVTLESLWIYNDPLGGQPNCPLIVKDGYLYTGFWNSETGNANFVCLSITDEDPADTMEEKCNSWYRTAKGGYYWAGAYAGDGFIMVGTDDGDNSCIGQTSRLLLLDAETGVLLDSIDHLNGDIRSSIVYDEGTNAYYFTSKGGSFYSVQVSNGQTLTNLWSVALDNGVGGIPMSTCSPVVYNGRAYIGVSGAGQFSAYSGHNITVVDLKAATIAYSIQTQGYPQTSGLLTTAYEEESGYVYVYFFDNYTPGKLRVLRDRPGQTVADYVTAERGRNTAYALFTPTGIQAQYAICSPIVDDYGTIYFKNDSAHLMAFGSAIEKIEVTTNPTKMNYVEGDKFNPEGMVVTATYANGKTRDITQYVTYNQEQLTGADQVLTISFEHVMYHNQENGTEMTAGVVSQTPSVTLNLTIKAGTLGDINDDGNIDQMDAQIILDAEVQQIADELNPWVADVSGDGIIDSNDAVLILQFADGQIPQFPGTEH